MSRRAVRLKPRTSKVARWGPGKLHVEQARPGGEHEMAGSGVLDQARLADTLAEIKSYIRRDFTTSREIPWTNPDGVVSFLGKHWADDAKALGCAV
jgi:hypothetical protein